MTPKRHSPISPTGVTDITEQAFRSLFECRSGPRGLSPIHVRIAAEGERFSLTLKVGQTRVLDGPWTSRLCLDGEELHPVGSWELVCRHRSRRVSYLEACQAWSGGVALWRHVLLAREDGWLILGDAVRAQNPGHWEYLSELTATDRISWRGTPSHTEGWICSKGQPVWRVLPVFASEWKTGSGLQPLDIVDRRLEIRGTFRGRGFFAPVWIDLFRSRAAQALTWRQLTVAEERRNLHPDEAAAYRVQVGTKHWLFYRTIGPAGKRSFFGHQLTSDLLLARWDHDKGVVPLLELVEVPD